MDTMTKHKRKELNSDLDIVGLGRIISYNNLRNNVQTKLWKQVNLRQVSSSIYLIKQLKGLKNIYFSCPNVRSKIEQYYVYIWLINDWRLNAQDYHVGTSGEEGLRIWRRQLTQFCILAEIWQIRF